MTAIALTASPLDILDDPLEQARFTRWLNSGAGPAEAVSALQISGITCAACAGVIEAAVRRVPGVCEVQVSAAAQRASVRWQPGVAQVSAIVGAIRDAGYDAAPDSAAPARELRRREQRSALWRLFVAAFCAMQVMSFAAPGYFAPAGDLAPDLRQLLGWGSWLMTLPVMVFSAGPFFQGAWQALRARRIGMDVPVALGLLTAFVASTGATFEPGGLFGTEVYYDSLTMFVSFLLGARWLELRARHRAAQALEEAALGLPATAWRLGPDGQAREVSVQRLAPGDVLRVPLGQAFAADGTVLSGHTQADERLLTGESAPVPRGPGDEVVAGSLNLGAPVTMRVLRTGADTRQQAILALMREAATQRPASVAAVDRWAGPFLWGVLALAGAAAAAWSVIDPSRAVSVAVAVLIVTCPCALSLSAPAALLAAASSLARRGVMLRHLDVLERLPRLRVMWLDKTGTLTTEAPQGLALDADPAPPAPEREALAAAAAALARWSTHPLSRALAALVTPSMPAPAWRDVAEHPGLGLSGCDEAGRTWRLGAPHWVAQRDHAEAGEAAALAFGCDGRIRLRWTLHETLREDAAATVAGLKAAGIEPRLLSGDAPERVQAMAAALGIAHWHARATPQSKLQALQDSRVGGACVGMVGDGLNDAPVLASADVSFALGHGALAARAQADAVITSARLGDILVAQAQARRCMRIVRQNMVWAVVYNAACIPLALVGWLPPWAAGLGMAISSLAVVANALRLARLPDSPAA